MTLTDSHCHIYSEYYDNIDEILEISKNNNVCRWLNNGCDTPSNKEVISLIGKHPNMFGAIGIHPENVESWTEEDVDYIKNNLSNNKVVAIGEIGLDYHYTKDNKEEQIKLLERMLSIAQDYNLPVIIHSREATLDTINTLKKYNVHGVIHSFSGSLETAKEYLKMGYYLGINGVVTFKNSNLKDVVKNIPLDRIILETDSPFLTPEPFRGKQNNPGHILDIATFVAKVYEIPLEELSNITEENVNRSFNIKS